MMWKTTLPLLAGVICSSSLAAETIRIGIGHQSMCTDTYTAGIIVKELDLISKHLPQDGKYADASFEFEWKDYTSGPPITNMMMANKLDFGVMGDYPLIVNGAKFQETESLRTLYVAGTGYNLHGSGNAIVVPADSDVYSFSDLKGKDLSVPVGSAAWGMVLKAMQDAGMESGDIEIKNQSPPVGAANIAKGRISAHADFCPWSEIMEYRGTGRKIYDGSETSVPYLHGVVVRQDYAEEYPEVVVAFVKAIVEAGEWVREDPVRAAENLEKWTGVEKEVQYLYFSDGGHLTLDPTIKTPWIEALAYNHGVLEKEGKVPPLDLDAWIEDSYVRQAFAELGRDYDAENEIVSDPTQKNPDLPAGEVWHASKGIERFDSVREMVQAVAGYEQSGQKVNASYVYDQATALKLFGKVAFYVQGPDSELTAFMRKPDAEAYARNGGGAVIGYDVAVARAVEAAESAAGSTAARDERKHLDSALAVN